MKFAGHPGLPPDRKSSVETILDELDLPDPFDVEELISCVSRMRGRPIYLHTLPGLTTEMPCGSWVAMERTDHIWVEDATSPLHRDHIVLHEISHMLLDHQPKQALGRIFTHLEPELIARMLGRTSYETEEERAAETLAGLIATRAARRPTAGRTTSTTLRRLNSVLSDS